MDLTQDQILVEFKRQVQLCSGIGLENMLAIVKEQFPEKHEWQFYMNGTFCKKCGCHIGDKRSCV